MENCEGSRGLLSLAPSFLLGDEIILKTIELGSQEHQRHDDSMGVVAVAVAAVDPVQNVKTADAIFSEVKAQPINGAIIAKPLLNNQLQTILFSDQEITHSRQIC